MAEFATHTATVLSGLTEGDVPPDANLTIEQVVTNGDDVVDRFHVRLSGGTVEVVPGPAEAADVTITQDVETARALRSGDTHAQRAFLTGRLSIDGDIDRLLEHGPLLSSLLRGPDA